MVGILSLAAINHSLANVLADRNPARALHFVSNHPVALAGRADLLLRAGQSTDAERSALAAVKNAPIVSDSFEVIGRIRSASKDNEGAKEAFEYAARLNRREASAQIWLSHWALLRNDIASALRHFDIAMRVSRQSRTTLFPLLAEVLAHDQAIPLISPMLAREPSWLEGFLKYSIRNSKSLVNLAGIVALLPEDSVAHNPETRGWLLSQLVAGGHYSDAAKYMQAIESDQADAFIRDRFFEEPGPYKPFDWTYTREADLFATPNTDTAGLEYYGDVGRGGRVARQLLTLQPGTYELASAGRNHSTDRDGGAIWTITCANVRKELARLRLGEGGTTSGAVEASFTIPTNGCPAQWLDLMLVATFAPKGVTGVVHSVAIESKSGDVLSSGG